MGILDTSFKVENYIKPINEFVDERKNYEFGAVSYTEEDIRDAKEWAEMNNRVIITPCESLAELEALWTAWCSQTKKARRESDWKSEEYFGLINQYHYEILKDQFLSLDIDYPNSDILDEAALDNDSLETNGISYSPVDVENAIEWSRMNDVPIIRPTRSLEDLEKLWDNYNSYHRDIRRESDWKSIECFGVCYRPKAYNKEVIPKQGRVIFCGNHRHAFDQFPVCISTKRTIYWMAKKEYFDSKWGCFFSYSLISS